MYTDEFVFNQSRLSANTTAEKPSSQDLDRVMNSVYELKQ